LLGHQRFSLGRFRDIMPFPKLLITEQAILRVPLYHALITPEHTLLDRMNPLTYAGKKPGMKVAQNLFISNGSLLSPSERKT
jgi:hypothetical protein